MNTCSSDLHMFFFLLFPVSWWYLRVQNLISGTIIYMTKNNVTKKTWLSPQTLPFYLQYYCEAGWGALEYGRYQKQYCTWKELRQIIPRDTEEIVLKYFKEKKKSPAAVLHEARPRQLQGCLTRVIGWRHCSKYYSCRLRAKLESSLSPTRYEICLQQCSVIFDASIRRM